VDPATVDVYETKAGEWLDRRGAAPRDELGLRMRSEAGAGLVVDLGCGTGRYLSQIGLPVVGLDITAAMLELASVHGCPLVRADLESLPFADRALDGAFARHSYLHLPKDRAAAAFAEVRRVLRDGGALVLTLICGEYSGHDLPGDDFPGRYFAFWSPDELTSALTAAGFGDVVVEGVDRPRGELDLHAIARAQPAVTNRSQVYG
jgi:SAM-dependent methyltransferase